MKQKYFIILSVIAVLLLLRFGVIPNLNKSTAAADCAQTTLTSLRENADLIIIGRAAREQVKTEGLLHRGTIYTYTTIDDIKVIKGDFSESTLETKQSYGCDPLTGYCVYTSVTSPFKIGENYLLFLNPALKFDSSDVEPPPSSFGENKSITQGKEAEMGVFGGFSGCGGKYHLSDAISDEDIKTMVISGNEDRWREFLATLVKETELGTTNPSSTQGTPQQ